ncbi:MAG: glutamate--cysteine ligase [Gammaproteobacteria bacterium]|nr:glutamate--cysteine ligase [Gammaproteobacteria bacterium]
MVKESHPAVARLTNTAIHSAMINIDTLLHAQQTVIEQWFHRQWQRLPAPFYASVDLRYADFKLAPIDTNLFPAGFNNLPLSVYPRAADAVRAEVERLCPSARGTVLVPENHTRNLFYFENLAALSAIFTAAGLKVRMGSMLPEITAPMPMALPSGRALVLEPLKRTDNKVRVDDFEPCFVLLNNDLSGGRPAILENIDQPIVPPLALGWSSRRKSDHFAHYRDIAAEFGNLVGIDPWLIDPIFRNCGQIDFQNREGEDCLSYNVEAVLQEVGEKYRQYGIDRQPFVIVKADAGTYGMAIMTITHPDQVRELNRKQRTKMAHSKEGRAVTQVLVQEGVYTSETKGTPPATSEPVIYMIGPRVIGGFYRLHGERGPTENLNAPGMRFEPMPAEPSAGEAGLFYAYGVTARLALLAAAREMQAADRDAA